MNIVRKQVGKGGQETFHRLSTTMLKESNMYDNKNTLVEAEKMSARSSEEEKRSIEFMTWHWSRRQNFPYFHNTIHIFWRFSLNRELAKDFQPAKKKAFNSELLREAWKNDSISFRITVLLLQKSSSFRLEAQKNFRTSFSAAAFSLSTRRFELL